MEPTTFSSNTLRFGRHGRGSLLFLLVASAALAAASVGDISPPPRFLVITPSMRTVALGEDTGLLPEFRVVDDLGRPVIGATWTASDPAIAELIAGDTIKVKPKAAGHVTISAACGGFSAHAEIAVLEGEELPYGTVEWSVLPLPGHRTSRINQAAPVSDAPDLYSVEDANGNDVVVRAFNYRGVQKWLARLEDIQPIRNPQAQRPGAKAVSSTQGKVIMTMGDHDGGIVLLLEADANRHSIVRLDGLTGKETWRYASSGRLGPEWTLNHGGILFVAETLSSPSEASILAIEGKSGDVKFRVPLPMSKSGTRNLQCVPEKDDVKIQPSRTGLPMSANDGKTYFEVEVTTDILDHMPCGVGTRVYENELRLLQISTDGTTAWRTLQHFTQRGTDPSAEQPRAFVVEVIPDGLGGLQAAWNYAEMAIGSRPKVLEARITRVFVPGQNNDSIPLRFEAVVQSEYTLPMPGWTDDPWVPASYMVLCEENVGCVTNGRKIVTYDVASGTLKWTWEPERGGVDLIMATGGRGLMVSSGGRLVFLDEKGKAVYARWTPESPSEILDSSTLRIVSLNASGKPTGTALYVRSFEMFALGRWFAVQTRDPAGGGGALLCIYAKGG